MPTTLRQLIDLTEQQFVRADLCYGHGADNALDEAACLVLGALDIPFDAAPERLNETLAGPEHERIKQLVKVRIRSRKPVAYLINKAWFAGLCFYVDERVLIPRSPLAELIREGFSPWIDAAAVNRVLDLGAGSGCIAIACAAVFPDAAIDASDICPKALEVARDNRERHAHARRVNLLRSDLFEALEDRKYDIIISNPPYVPAGEMSALPVEYRHEPSRALAAGGDGLAVIERILLAAHKHITPHGLLAVEAGSGRAALEARYPRTPFIWPDLEQGGEGVFLLPAQDLSSITGDPGLPGSRAGSGAICGLNT